MLSITVAISPALPLMVMMMVGKCLSSRAHNKSKCKNWNNRQLFHCCSPPHNSRFRSNLDRTTWSSREESGLWELAKIIQPLAIVSIARSQDRYFLEMTVLPAFLLVAFLTMCFLATTRWCDFETGLFEGVVGAAIAMLPLNIVKPSINGINLFMTFTSFVIVFC